MVRAIYKEEIFNRLRQFLPDYQSARVPKYCPYQIIFTTPADITSTGPARDKYIHWKQMFIIDVRICTWAAILLVLHNLSDRQKYVCCRSEATLSNPLLQKLPRLVPIAPRSIFFSSQLQDEIFLLFGFSQIINSCFDICIEEGVSTNRKPIR